jgi:hypothetical protein
MARTFIRQDTQIRNSSGSYASNIAPNFSNYEDTVTNLEEDLNNIRSQIQNFINRDGATFPTGDWYDDLAAPVTSLEAGVPRGINKLNTELHNLERKRVLTQFASLTDVLVSGSNNFTVLSFAELPTPDISSPYAVAVGISSVVTGTVAASGSIGSHSLELVSGSTLISPKNLCTIVTGSVRDPLLSDGRAIYGLFQTDKTDGQLLAGGDAQLSFVRVTATGDGLEAVPVGDIENKVINYVSVTRKALEDLSEQDFLRGAEIDVPSAQAGVDRQNVYDNQGTTTVTSNFDATLDLAATKFWEIGDANSATLFKVTEANGTNATTVLVDSGVDFFDVNAVDVDFDQGIKVDTGGTDIHLGVNAGVIETTGTDNLRIIGAGELTFDDGNQAGSTWVGTDGIKLSDTSAEWSLFSASFGEVSLLEAISQAKRRDKVYVEINVPTIAADTNVVFPTNIDADLPQLASGSFLYDYDVYLNGELMRPGVDASANNDYYPGSVDKSLRFEFQLRTGDVICVVPYAR